MINFPTWPCSYPEKPVENNNSDKKLEKRISLIQPNISLDLEDLLKTLMSFSTLNSSDLTQKPPKLSIEKLAKGSYVVKSINKLAAQQPSLFEGTKWDTNLDASYSKDGEIPFPEEPF